jgi:signal-transduction protein with cAMP-binding, CBS, and nucleotidyltransferase domain
VRDIIRKKGNKVITILQDVSVYEALSLMTERDIGALLVTNRTGKAVGIVSYQDCTQKIILDEKPVKSTPVSRIMVEDIIGTSMEKTAEECIVVMLEKRIRHLPVFDGGNVVGLVSIGDAVKSIVERQRVEIKQLSSYIAGTYV